MKKIFILITLLGLSPLCAQDSIIGTWYIIENDGVSRERIILSADVMITERLKTYGVDEPYWEKDKESSIVSLEKKGTIFEILGQLPGESSYFVGEFWSKKGELKAFQIKEAFESKEVALKKLGSVPAKNLLSKTYYSEVRKEEIDKLPTMETLTKEDLIITMKAILEYSKKLEEYINKSEDKHARFFAVKAIEDLKNQKFLELGYNPFVFVNPYYMDRFKEDADVNELNEQMTLMRF